MTDNDIKQVLTAKVTEAWELLDEKWYGCFADKYDFPSIKFDARGGLAGQAITYSYSRQTTIRFNLSIARDNFDTFINRTPAHEVAHIAAGVLGSKGHDKIWRLVMKHLGVDSSRCHNYNTPLPAGGGLYKCDSCGSEHQLSKLRHNRQQLRVRYRCKCSGSLTLI